MPCGFGERAATSLDIMIRRITGDRACAREHKRRPQSRHFRSDLDPRGEY